MKKKAEEGNLPFQLPEPFEKEKKSVVKAARDLHYPEDVIKRLKIAKTPTEISNILRDARNRE